MRYGEYIVEVERNWEVNLAPKQASFSGVATALIRIFLNCNSISHSAQPVAAAIPEREGKLSKLNASKDRKKSNFHF